MKAKLLKKFRKRFTVRVHPCGIRIFVDGKPTTAYYTIVNHKAQRVYYFKTSADVALCCAGEILGVYSEFEFERVRINRREFLKYKRALNQT